MLCQDVVVSKSRFNRGLGHPFNHFILADHLTIPPLDAATTKVDQLRFIITRINLKKGTHPFKCPMQPSELNCHCQSKWIKRDWSSNFIMSSHLSIWRRDSSFESIIQELEVEGPSGPRLLAGGPSGLLTSSLAPFGRSGCVTQGGGTLSVTEQ